MSFDHVALFGEDHPEPDRYVLRGLASGSVWCALSVGGRAALVRKSGELVPNEDALCAAEHGGRVLLAVADSHFGHAASHVVIERLHRALQARADVAPGREGTQLLRDPRAPASSLEPLPRDVDELRDLIAACADTAPSGAAPGRALGAGPLAQVAARRSETTLVVAVVDRVARVVFGVSVGDSSAVALGRDTRARWLTRATQRYATPRDPATLGRDALTVFRAPLSAGDVVVVFSDGVNECVYGSPATSIGSRHLEALWSRSSAGAMAATEAQVPDPRRLAHRTGRAPDAEGLGGGRPGSCERFVDGLMALALAGVDGHPGGEDNIALAAAHLVP